MKVIRSAQLVPLVESWILKVQVAKVEATEMTCRWPIPPPAVAGTIYKLRRLRRTAHITDEQTRLTYHALQLDMQVGMGLLEGDGSEPVMMLRWSNNQGETFGNEHWISAGALGQYGTRAIWRQLGQGRDRVWELVVDKPVAWRFSNAYLRFTKGTS